MTRPQAPKTHPHTYIAFILILVLVGTCFALLAGCDDPFSPPDGTVPFDPPAIYSDWWAEVEECSGLSGTFGLVQWFEFPEPFLETVYGDRTLVLGFWRPPHNIYLSSDVKDAPIRVKGEMLHDLLRGDGMHSDPVWTQCNLGPHHQ